MAATGAVALSGSVALGGSRGDLLRGIHSFASSYVADADVWVSNPGDNQAVNEFSPDGYSTAIARGPGVASVRAFQGAFVSLGQRRVWVIARPPGVGGLAGLRLLGVKPARLRRALVAAPGWLISRVPPALALEDQWATPAAR